MLKFPTFDLMPGTLAQALVMLRKSQDGNTDEFFIFRVSNFASA